MVIVLPPRVVVRVQRVSVWKVLSVVSILVARLIPCTVLTAACTQFPECTQPLAASRPWWMLFALLGQSSCLAPTHLQVCY